MGYFNQSPNNNPLKSSGLYVQHPSTYDVDDEEDDSLEEDNCISDSEEGSRLPNLLVYRQGKEPLGIARPVNYPSSNSHLFHTDVVAQEVPNTPPNEGSPEDLLALHHSGESIHIERNDYHNMILHNFRHELTLDEEDEEGDYFSSDHSPHDDNEEFRIDRGQPRKEFESMIELPQVVRKRPKSHSQQNIRPISSGSHNLKPIQPNFVTNSRPQQCLFTPAQQSKLATQLSNHFQLLVQAFIISRQKTNQAGITTSIWGMLSQLKQRKDAALANKALYLSNNGSSYHNTLDGQHKTTSVLDVPGLNLIKELEVFDNPENCSSIALHTSLKMFTPYFNPMYAIDLTNAPLTGGRLRFTPAEDRLLAIGLEKFGTSDWDSIQKHVLPTKSVPQIINRYKNMSSSRAADNPIKAFKLAKTTPLTEEETKKLDQGVKVYGYRWDLISKMVLPNRQPDILSKHWADLQKKRLSNNTGSSSASASGVSSSHSLSCVSGTGWSGGPAGGLLSAPIPTTTASTTGICTGMGTVTVTVMGSQTEIVPNMSASTSPTLPVSSAVGCSSSPLTSPPSTCLGGLSIDGPPSSSSICGSGSSSPTSTIMTKKRTNVLIKDILPDLKKLRSHETELGHMGFPRRLPDNVIDQCSVDQQQVQDYQLKQSGHIPVGHIGELSLSCSGVATADADADVDVGSIAKDRLSEGYKEVPHHKTLEQLRTELWFVSENLSEVLIPPLSKSVEAVSTSNASEFEQEDLSDSDEDVDKTFKNRHSHSQSQRVLVPINPLTPTEDQRSVFWSNEEDHCLRLAASNMGPVLSTWQHISNVGLIQKTPQQIHQRYLELCPITDSQ
eukprot:TRINITY_DN15636_c0_g1_i1.p1 TRINITY_DN15636_c0_g1~~TRINITY_DN15636_c0_g1_i1.p1  ORF type:complete len:847 (+),score=125.41 TRINITY_DN15636_c0_g1_i1:27-2543(+)